MTIGINNITGIGFGSTLLIINIILLVLIFFTNRKMIGPGTLINIVGCGYVSDFVLIILDMLIPEQLLFIRVIVLAAGIFFVCLGAALYMEAKLGISPYDALAIVICEKIHRPKWFRWMRIATDAACVLTGYLLGSLVGIATLVVVIFTGPLIALFRDIIAKQMQRQI
jgi:uncharacterized membrane protein YczE